MGEKVLLFFYSWSKKRVRNFPFFLLLFSELVKILIILYLNYNFAFHRKRKHVDLSKVKIQTIFENLCVHTE